MAIAKSTASKKQKAATPAAKATAKKAAPKSAAPKKAAPKKAAPKKAAPKKAAPSAKTPPAKAPSAKAPSAKAPSTKAPPTKVAAKPSSGGIRVVRVGDAKSRRKDPAVEVPAKIAKLFPKGDDVRLGQAADGTYYAIAEEGAEGAGPSQSQSPRFGLYWLEGDTIRKGDRLRFLAGDPTFDREHGFIYLVAGGRRIVRFSIDTGVSDEPEIEGIARPGRETTISGVHVLSGGRLLCDVSFEEPYERHLFVVEPRGSHFAAAYSVPFFGDVAVLDRRIVFGGAKRFFVLVAGAECFRTLKQLDDQSSQHDMVLNGRPRFYLKEGTFELEGVLEALRAADVESLPVFDGWNGPPPLEYDD